MSLLAPLFLAGGLLIGLPLALHFLRKKTTRPVPFPSIRFLGAQIIQEEKRHKIRRLIVLSLRCLAILLIALAFARPFFGAVQKRDGRAVVVVVDNSFSMQSAGRWDSLKAWALNEISPLRAGDRCGVVLMQPSPTWLQEISDDPDKAREAIRSLEPGYQSTSYNRPLRFAAEVLAALPARERKLVVLADQQRLGWQGVNFAEPLAAGVNVVFSPAQPTPPRQAAVTNLRIQPHARSATLEIECKLFEPASDDRTLRVFLEGNKVAEVPLKLQRGEPSITRLRIDLPEASETSYGIWAELNRDDLPADDFRYGVVDPSNAIPVMISPPPVGVDFASPAISATVAHRSLPFRALTWPVDPWPDRSVLVWQGDLGAEGARQLASHLQAGRGVLVFADGSPEQDQWLAKAGIFLEPLSGGEQWYLTDCDLESPVFSSFSPKTLLPLLRVQFTKGWSIGGENVRALAHWPDGTTALAEANVGDAKILVCGFNPQREGSDLAVSPAFVPLLHRMLANLVDETEKTNAHIIGMPLALPDGNGLWEARDSARPVLPSELTSGLVRPAIPGIYRFTPTQGMPQLFAVNVAPEESNLAPWPSPEDFDRLQAPPPSRYANSTASQNLPVDPLAGQKQNSWWSLLVLAVLVLLIELRLANRTAR